MTNKLYKSVRDILYDMYSYEMSIPLRPTAPGTPAIPI
jgi:hypothetical protein